MIDKLKLWNFVSLHHSSVQYRVLGKHSQFQNYASILDHMWYNYLSSDEQSWLLDKIKSLQDDPIFFSKWEHLPFIKQVLDMIKNIDKPVKIYEPLTEQLTLFD